jgi:oxygen-independent coproporphyrinogen-3 oxidase
MFDGTCKQKQEVFGQPGQPGQLPERQPMPGCGALYVHVPFCLAKCRYCDFYSVGVDHDLARRYVRAIAGEMALHQHHITIPADTIFVGGGTPTSLGCDSLGQLLAIISPLAGANTEFSAEANPGTIDQAILQTMIDAGVNRINLGVQSFNDSELAGIGRIHDAATACAAVEMVRLSGVTNVGLDLIYGLPGQSLQSWQTSLTKALNLGITHLSCYALSFEHDTPLWQDLQAGKVQEMDESLQKECYYAAIEAAQSAGLAHYEISNFAAPGRQCRHNLTYWHNHSYLGLGPAAASYIDAVRRVNTADLQAYLSAMEAGNAPPSQQEQLAGPRLMAETAMLALRLTAGLDRQEFADRFGLDVTAAFPKSIARYTAIGALELAATHLRIANDFLFVADTILADIIAEAGGPATD